MRVYKILPLHDWTSAKDAGQFLGSPVDLADGYIHLSTAAQASETARKYFSGLTGLIVLEIEGEDLGAHLRWEPSRGGDLFPHLYAPLAVSQVLAVHEAPLGADGAPQIRVPA